PNHPASKPKKTPKQPADAKPNERLVFHVKKIEEEWSAFEGAWGQAVPYLITTGHLLIEAKAELKGQFGKMVKEQLPFSPRTAQRLMQIARNPVLADPSYETHLPTDTNTLAMLARTPEPKLRGWLKAGKITA